MGICSMNIRILKLDLTETNKQLERIADLLEGMLGSTDPLRTIDDYTIPENEVERIIYSNDRQEIIDHHVQRLGKEPR